MSDLEALVAEMIQGGSASNTRRDPLDSISSMVRRFIRGGDRSSTERRKLIDKIKGLSPAERMAAVLGGNSGT